jgi:hypothetical protein
MLLQRDGRHLRPRGIVLQHQMTSDSEGSAGSRKGLYELSSCGHRALLFDRAPALRGLRMSLDRMRVF